MLQSLPGGMLLLVWLLPAVAGLPVYTGDYQVDNQTEALLYLSKYGYIHYGGQREDAIRGGSGGRLERRSTGGQPTLLASAVQQFQAFAGLVATGTMDPATIEALKRPRCGVKDVIGFGARFKRYVLQGSRWKKKDLTYHISKYPRTKRITRPRLDLEVANSFKVWSEVSELTFTTTSAELADIEIRFERYDHGDGDDFDGAGGTLGHAFFPEFGGDIHMDDSEFWTVDLEVGFNLRNSLVHEIGHSLGLSHSDQDGAIMAPFYRNYQEDLVLHSDDIFAIRELYGEFAAKEVSRRRGSGSLCVDPSFDTIITTADLNTYIFRDDLYWKLDDFSVVKDGYPRSIQTDWPGLPNNIDAGFTKEDSNITYIFKGDQVWKFRNQEAVGGTATPLSLDTEFPGVPASPDTAFVWSGNGKIYFIKNDEYWKYEGGREPAVGPQYPVSTAVFNLPPGIISALQWKNKRTYFFTKDQFYRFNDFEMDIASDLPPYPRPISSWWLGCPQL